MLIIFDLFVFCVGLILAIGSIKRVLKGKFSILHICTIVFFIMQILQLFIGIFGSPDKIKYYYKYMYLAMTDVKTGIIYDIFSLLTIICLYFFANLFSKKYKQKIFNVNLKRYKSLMIIFLALLTIMPLVFGILFSPRPSIYLNFAYFYTHTYSLTDSIYIYQMEIMKNLCFISFFSIIGLYYLSDSKNKILYSIPIFLLTWLNGKRTLFIFILIAIIIIDFLKWDKNDNKRLKKIIGKSVFFAIVIILFYIFYNKITMKANFADNYLLYTIYFSRLCNVKISIYDLLYSNSMLENPFQTLIYNLLFFVPRSIWNNKPYPYYLYFTSYIFNGSGKIKITNYGFQVNMWSEFISNCGIVGYFLSLLFIILIIKKCESSNSNMVYLFGSIFALLYMVYGFEHIVQIVYILFILTVIISFIKKKIKY